MSPFARRVRAGLLAAGCIVLAGCVSLLPKAAPVQLYRFAAVEPSDAAAPANAAVIGEGDIAFDAAAAGDRILTVTGRDAAYIAGARWVSPAPTLFEEALVRTFERTAGAPRLARRVGAFIGAPLVLTLDVQAFEARYDQGAGAPPLAEVRVRAQLIRAADRSVAGERTFTTTARASDNRVGAIVQAFDEAVRKTFADLAAWSSGVAGPPAA